MIGNSRTHLSLDGVMADVTESAISCVVPFSLFLSGSFSLLEQWKPCWFGLSDDWYNWIACSVPSHFYISLNRCRDWSWIPWFTIGIWSWCRMWNRNRFWLWFWKRCCIWWKREIFKHQETTPELQKPCLRVSDRSDILLHANAKRLHVLLFFICIFRHWSGFKSVKDQHGLPIFIRVWWICRILSMENVLSGAELCSVLVNKFHHVNERTSSKFMDSAPPSIQL